MTKALFSWLALAMLCLYPVANVQAQSTQMQLQAVLDNATINDINGVTYGGLSAAVIQNNTDFFAITAGEADTGTPMDPNTRLGASDVSQTLAAILTLALLDEGKLELEDPISDYINTSSIGNGNIPGGTTITQLLSHTGGLDNVTDEPSYRSTLLGSANNVFSSTDILNTFVNDPPSLVGQYRYSNTNFIVLGLVLEAANGSETLDETVGRLLGSGIGLPGLTIYPGSDPMDLASIFAGSVPLTPINSEAGLLTGAGLSGNVISSPSILLSLFHVVTQGGILQPKTYIKLLDFDPSFGRFGDGYSLGLEQFEENFDGSNLMLIGHTGDINYASALLYSLDAETGVYVVSNNLNASEEDIYDLAVELLDVAINGAQVVPNIPPVMNAFVFPFFGVAPLTSTFDATTVFDIDGEIVCLEWLFDDGTTGEGEIFDKVYPTAGVFDAVLRATDNKGGVNTTTLHVVVQAAQNVTPTAIIDATPISGDAPLVVDVNGIDAFDPDGTIVSYDYDFGNGTTGSGEVTSVVYDVPGIYTITLTVTDNDGASDQASIGIEVLQAPNIPPTANLVANPEIGTVPLTVNVDASGSDDPDGVIVDYTYDFGNGTSGSGVTSTVTYDQVGTYQILLTVTDDEGAMSMDSVEIVVAITSTIPPIASWIVDPIMGSVPLTVDVDASASSDANGTIVDYTYDFGNGMTGAGVTTTVTYDMAGDYTLQLIVTDNDGLMDTISQLIVVNDVNQIPEVSFTNTTVIGFAPLTVDFDGSASNDPDGMIVDRDWDFGDGTLAIGSVVSHTYNTPGVYMATFTVTDNEGATNTASVQVVVYDPSQEIPEIQFIHNAFSASLDVQAYGQSIQNPLYYRAATSFEDIAPNPNAPLDFDPVGSGSGGLNGLSVTEPILPDGSYLGVIYGTFDDSDNFDLELAIEERDLPASGVPNGAIGLQFFHGSPGAGDVTIVANGITLFQEVEYGEFGLGYTIVPAGSYDVDVMLFGGAYTIARYRADLGFWAGRSAVIFATGTFNQGTFQPWVALDNGATFPLQQIPIPHPIAAPGGLPQTADVALELAPNPAKEQVNIWIDLPSDTPANLEIFDATGKQVKQASYGLLGAGAHQFELTIEDLPNGSYFIRLATQDEVLTKRLMIVK